jgi:glycosyltransferase involved in cell wall biosynthesis
MTSVLIPSFRRPGSLTRCLRSLSCQQMAPDEIIVVWQSDDYATRDVAEAAKHCLPCSIRVVHNPVTGIVPSENLALSAASGDVILLIDDDAAAPVDWVHKHVSFYEDELVGAVGGPADNFNIDGSKFPVHESEIVGKITFYGRLLGNMYDQPQDWRLRRPAEVHHLVGYNMSLRREAFDHFENGLRPYWQMFEADACFQVRRNGYQVLFDFGNVVSHYPLNTVYVLGRGGDPEIKIFNAAYNWAFVVSKHSPVGLRLIRAAYLLFVGSTSSPGLASALVTCLRSRAVRSESRILLKTWRNIFQGWGAGKRVRMRGANVQNALNRRRQAI